MHYHGLFSISLVICFIFWPSSTFSHALHPESIDRHAQFILTPSEIILIYEAILGVNPTERAAAAMDPDRDGVITDAERNAFVQRSAEQYGAAQRVRLGEHILQPRLHIGDAYSTFGHHGINVIKIDLGFRFPIPAEVPRGVTLPFEYRDEKLANIPGWKQVNLQACGVNYSGHIPYREYEPFDYEIIDAVGFFPSTNSIRGELMIPTDAVTDALETVPLPERTVFDAPPRYGGLALNMIGVAILLALLIGAAAFWYRERSIN